MWQINKYKYKIRIQIPKQTKLEVAHEDALAIEDSNHGDINDKDLAGLPVDDVEDRVSRLHLKSASNTQTVADDKRSVGKESLTVPAAEVKKSRSHDQVTKCPDKVFRSHEVFRTTHEMSDLIRIRIGSEGAINSSKAMTMEKLSQCKTGDKKTSRRKYDVQSACHSEPR